MSYLTTSAGAPVDNNVNALTAGPDGPVLIQDHHLIDSLAHFDRERIPERVVHAKGAGAHGYFEVTQDVTRFCKAKFLNRVGKRTPAFVRFSTVGGEKGSADTARDPRGFAVKFYTEEGNYDMVGNNTPVFFLREPTQFPNFIHTQKRNPQTNLPDPNAFWDFLSLTPESVHQVTILFSDRGTPNGYRHMNGYSSHTFKWVNAEGVPVWVKYHFKTEAGVQNLTAEQADALKASDPDYATRDLFEHIASGNAATWKVFVQVMPYEQAWSYRFNPFDVTKIWPHKDFPLHEIGRLVLNRNPTNYHAEVEQAAFSPSHLVPGVEPSPDKMLQGRLFSYPDTHRYRLGVNYNQIPINCPFATRVTNFQRDGFMAVNGNGGAAPNYGPNSYGHADPTGPATSIAPFRVQGEARRWQSSHPNDDFVQAGNLYRNVLTPTERDHLVANIAGHLKNARQDLQIRQIQIFLKADKEYGTRIAQAIGLDLSKL